MRIGVVLLIDQLPVETSIICCFKMLQKILKSTNLKMLQKKIKSSLGAEEASQSPSCHRAIVFPGEFTP